MKSKAGTTPSGFALVTTLMLMLLLGLLALGMLSLSSISLRSSSQESAMAEARSNARMALVLAIGKLQKFTGPDTRITAPANIVEDAAPPLTGVWKSWEGGNHDSTGRPIKPDYETKGKSVSANGRFLTWLVSGSLPDEDPAEPGNRPSDLVSTSLGSTSVPLLSKGTLGGNPGEVHVVPLESPNGGRFAWWVSPENQKARLSQPHKPRTADVTAWADMAKSHTVPDPEPFGLENLLTDAENYDPDPNDPKDASRAISLATTKLIATNANAEPQHDFHDLSISSVGLLTNTATGGWRKDLSILTEKWDDIYSRYPEAKLPLFRFSPEAGKTSLAQKPTLSEYDIAQSIFYPWSAYTQFPNSNKAPLTYHSASGSWQSLVNFATAYKTANYDTTTKTASVPIGWSGTSIYRGSGISVQNNDFYRHYHERGFNGSVPDPKLELEPVVARVQMIIQAKTHISPQYEGKPEAESQYRVNLRIIPVYTLWNPYNVEIVHSYGSSYTPGEGYNQDSDFGIQVMRSLPLALSITNKTAPPPNGNDFVFVTPGTDSHIDGTTTVTDVKMAENNSGDRSFKGSYFSAGSNNWTITGWLPLEFTLKPGEVKQFAPRFKSPVVGGTTTSASTSLGIRLKEGYNRADDLGIAIQYEENFDAGNGNTYNQLYKVPGSRGKDELHGSDSINIAARSDRYTKILANESPGGGVLFSVGTPRYNVQLANIESGEVPKGTNYIKSVMATVSPMTWSETYWPSFDFDDFPEYTASELATTNWNDLISISFGPRLTFGGPTTDPQNNSTKGVLQSSPFASDTFSIAEEKPENHPANGAYDISYHVFGTGNDNILPAEGTTGYISTGYDDVTGISRLVMAEIPLRPMASLVELQHWNLRGKNPFPPHQFNLIGNSAATPMVEKDSILAGNPISGAPATNLQHDDAYCANHLLFDDWFLSSIAPDPESFGSDIKRDIVTVYEDFLKGNGALANRAYRAIQEDRDLSPSEAAARADDILNSKNDYSGADGWLKVASRLEVKGMFNVNSTSPKAWRALLGHARNQQVAHHSADGIELDPDPHDHVVSRHTVSSDVEAGKPSETMTLPIGSEYAGFRTLDSNQLDDLADKIVDQIRRRGPFLSLSEFVNRKLTPNADEEELALAGALQSALDNLSDDPVQNLKDTSNPATTLSSATMDPNADPRLADVDYAFAKASEGVSTYGLPAYIRQADILRPLAPVLSARDDTFTIRAYGDSRDADGRITAQAWCEATIRRNRDFIDPQDPADSIEPPVNEMNQKFGRKYDVISFRWLNKSEV